MKKLWHSEKWKLHQRRRAESELKHKLRTGRRRRESRPKVPSSTDERIEAPTILSMIENPEGTIRFLRKIEDCFERGNRPLIDVGSVTTLTVDAIVLLLSRLRKNSRFWGNLPQDPAANALFRESGFLDHVAGKNIVPIEPHGSVRKATDETAKGTQAQKLIGIVTRGLFGTPRRSPGSYKTLIECMNNTRNWAHKPGSLSQEKWWVLAYYDVASKKGIFAFADNGVGILKSANMPLFRRAMTATGFQSKDSILKSLLGGRIPSASGLKNRGLGLPGMKKDAEAGRIRNLRIITNHVYADVVADEFRTMSTSFNGTLIYWELGATL